MKKRFWIFYYDGDAVYTRHFETKKILTKREMHDLQIRAESIFRSIPRSKRHKGFAAVSQKDAFILIDKYLAHNEQVIIC